jgi:hypothetical protein
MGSRWGYLRGGDWVKNNSLKQHNMSVVYSDVLKCIYSKLGMAK